MTKLISRVAAVVFGMTASSCHASHSSENARVDPPAVKPPTTMARPLGGSAVGGGGFHILTGNLTFVEVGGGFLQQQTFFRDVDTALSAATPRIGESVTFLGKWFRVIDIKRSYDDGPFVAVMCQPIR